MDPASFKSLQQLRRPSAIEAFRIEYWAMEEAKLRRQPPEKELSRRIALVVGGGSGIGREVALLAAARGAHVMIADRRERPLQASPDELRRSPRRNSLPRPASISAAARPFAQALSATIAAFGGVDILINTAALFPSSPDGVITDDLWAATLDINVTANYMLADEAAKIFAEQDLDGSIVLTSSANAVVAKRGSEAYDVSKAALRTWCANWPYRSRPGCA